MYSFNADRQAADYPELLRRERQAQGMSQAAFAKAAGYSPVMQGRYETERGKGNSAIPSEKTAKAIREMIKTTGAATSSASRQSSEIVLPTEAKSLKSVTTQQIEQAFALALRTLTGSHFKVEIKEVGWEGGAGNRATISIIVGTESGTA